MEGDLFQNPLLHGIGYQGAVESQHGDLGALFHHIQAHSPCGGGQHLISRKVNAGNSGFVLKKRLQMWQDVSVEPVIRHI